MSMTRDAQFEELQQLIPNLKLAIGIDGFRSELSKLSTGDHYIYFQNGDMHSLVRANLSKNPIQFTYDDPKGHVSPQGLRNAIAEFVWERSEKVKYVSAGVDPVVAFNNWKEKHLADFYKDFTLEAKKVSQQGFLSESEKSMYVETAAIDSSLVGSFKRLKSQGQLAPAPLQEKLQQPQSGKPLSRLQRFGMTMFNMGKKPQQEQKKPEDVRTPSPTDKRNG